MAQTSRISCAKCGESLLRVRGIPINNQVVCQRCYNDTPRPIATDPRTETEPSQQPQYLACTYSASWDVEEWLNRKHEEGYELHSITPIGPSVLAIMRLEQPAPPRVTALPEGVTALRLHLLHILVEEYAQTAPPAAVVADSWWEMIKEVRALVSALRAALVDGGKP